MGLQKNAETLAKFLAYVLGRRPDEFGLVLDQDGYVKIKDLLKAVNEEDGWRHVRRAGIDEILITLPHPPVEIKENLIRARNRDKLPPNAPAQDLPKLLYTCVRRKAHAFVLEKGISPIGHTHVILSSDQKMAERMGKRIDQSPIMLTVNVQNSVQNGVMFYQSGETLFLAEFIPVNCFTAPPLPKEKADDKKQETEKPPPEEKFPGSFFMDFAKEKSHRTRPDREKKKDKIMREKDKKRERRKKQKMWDEW